MNKLLLSMYFWSGLGAMNVSEGPVVLQSQDIQIELPEVIANRSPILHDLMHGPLKTRIFQFKDINPVALELFGRFVKMVGHIKKLSRDQFYSITQKIPEFSLIPNPKISKDIIVDLVTLSDILDLPIMYEFLGYYLANRLLSYFDQTQQPAIRDYYFTPSELVKLTDPIKKEIARSYFLSSGKKLNLGVTFGFSISELVSVGKIPYSKTGELDLSNLNINSLEGLLDIPGIKRVKKLVLSHNQLEIIPADVLGQLPFIVDLRLNNNKIKEISPTAFSLHIFLQLDLSNNQMSEVGKNTLGNFNAADTINLKGNPIEKIDPSIFQMNISTIGLPDTPAGKRAVVVFQRAGINVF